MEREKNIASAGFYVDEAGDSVLWGRRGNVQVGTLGCSRYFIMGMAVIAKPEELASAMEELRTEVLSSPYFKDVPSVQPSKNKTAKFFHAKDDPDAIRYQVFKLLLKHNITFHSVVRDKLEALRIAQDFRKVQPTYVYRQDQLYDDLVRRLMQDKLHTPGIKPVVFAKRGSTDRTQALENALHTARERWCRSNGIKHDGTPVSVMPARSWECAGLQAVDYYLWALQRCYEKSEDGFITMMWPQVCCIWDSDDKRTGGGEGIRYTQEKPLTAALCARDIGSSEG